MRYHGRYEGSAGKSRMVALQTCSQSVDSICLLWTRYGVLVKLLMLEDVVGLPDQSHGISPSRARLSTKEFHQRLIKMIHDDSELDL